MHAKILALVTFVTAAVAAPGVSDHDATVSCNALHQQCCNTVQEANPHTVQTVVDWAKLNGIPLKAETITGLVGFSCNPISTIGNGGNSCNESPVCCSDNSFRGVFALGCSPINT